MPVTQPDGSVTGSLLRDEPVAAAPAVLEPEVQPAPVVVKAEKKEVGDADR